jgi:hypothetical protein
MMGQRKTLHGHSAMRASRSWVAGSMLFGLSLWAMPAQAACPSSPRELTGEPVVILNDLAEQSDSLLAAMDSYSVGMEACYDSPLGPLELAPRVDQAERLASKMLALRGLAEAKVRGNEFEFEDLLSSDMWAHIESLRVASAYGAAWGHLAQAVRHVSANDKRAALHRVRADLQKLTFEFKHPVLVQRAMYGLALAQVENGDVAQAQDTLDRLLSSLRRNDARQFQAAVQAFYDEISAPGYQPPLPPASRDADADAGANEGPSQPNFRGDMGGQGEAALKAALQALKELRSADEIAALLEPAFGASPATVRQALDLASRDKTLLEALGYQPGPGLRQMRNGFATQRFSVVREGWRGVKPYYPYMPAALKRQVDYQMGASLVTLGDLPLALMHLRSALVGLAQGPHRTRIEKLIVLAQLSDNTPSDAARVRLAERFREIPPREAEAPLELDHVLALRARVVLARHAATQKQWTKADGLMAGFGPDMPAYQLFLGMRVRLVAQSVSEAAQKGLVAEAVQKQAVGGQILYDLWRDSDCPPGCLAGDRLAVHRAGLDLALKGNLDSQLFGQAWASFEAEGGDTRPILPQALAYLVDKYDADRLIALLDPSEEGRAGLVLGQWKKLLGEMQESRQIAAYYDFLSLGLGDLQGRPQAVALEALIAYDLANMRPQQALDLADRLAKAFPRRPNAWFLRAAALQGLERDLEAARALSSLARRTPADDPVGMGARLGLSAVFLSLGKVDTACAMRDKTFSRPNATQNWAKAIQAFAELKDWGVATQQACATKLAPIQKTSGGSGASR